MKNSVISTTIDIDSLRKRGSHPEAGALLLFCGDVRNHSHSRSVTHLAYSAHPSMALKQIDAIVDEAIQRWNLCYAEVVHRIGKMEVSECSIAICVSSPHRDEAYKASRFIIDAIKHTVPIWKKEYFVEGESEWSEGCSACSLEEYRSDLAAK